MKEFDLDGVVAAIRAHRGEPPYRSLECDNCGRVYGGVEAEYRQAVDWLLTKLVRDDLSACELINRRVMHYRRITEAGGDLEVK